MRRLRLMDFPIFDVYHPDSPVTVEQQPIGPRLGDQGQALVPDDRFQERVRRAPPFPIEGRRLFVPHSMQLTAGKIVGKRDVQFLKRPDEDVGGLRDVGGVGHLKRPVSAVRGVLQPDVPFLLAEIGDQVVPTPARIPG